MHVGSMGMDLSQIVQGAKQLVEFAEKINKQAGFKQITVLDVGGGVANNYHGDDDAVDFSTYKKEVIGQVPELQNYRILTEFGRSIFTKPGKYFHFFNVNITLLFKVFPFQELKQ